MGSRRSRSIKHEASDEPAVKPEVIIISDDPEPPGDIRIPVDFTPRDRPAQSLLPLPPNMPKSELYNVLNSFQYSQDYGLYICELFRDPRRYYIDTYFDEVADSAYGINELCRILGRIYTPMRPEERHVFLRFAGTLESLAARVRAAVART